MRNEPLAAAAPRIRGNVWLHWLAQLVGFAPLAVALSLWVVSLPQFDLSRMSDIGLISVMPVEFVLSLLILTVGFILILQLPQTSRLFPFLYLASFIWMIHGTPQLLYGTLRYSWSWKHVAIVDYIQRHGTVDPSINTLNIYHNWPGFFTLNTLLTELSGISSAYSYAGWAPAFFNLIDLGALLIIYRTLTSDRRLIWLGTWFFVLANWIGQDYFSPQAFTYFLYLIILGICLTWFRDPEMLSRKTVLRALHLDRIRWLNRPTPDDEWAEKLPIGQPYQRVGLVFFCFLAMTAIASTHQLTPLMLFTALVGLVILHICQVRSLPVTLAVITISWIIFLAVGYLHGSFLVVLDSLWNFVVNLNSNLVNLTVSSPGQVLVAQMDRALTIGVVGLGMFGFLRRIQKGNWDLPAVVLILTPLPLVVIPYGGEIIFRLYFFMLPFLAFFAASLFFPTKTSGKSLLTAAALILTSFMMLIGFSFGYYGKEKINYYPPDEVNAANYIAEHAQPGALIYTAAWDWPLQIHNYEDYQYEAMANFDKHYQAEILADPVDVIAKEMSNFPSAFLILTNSQKADVYMTGVLPPTALDDIVTALARSPRFRIIYQNSDAIVFTLASQTGGQSK